MNKFVFWIEKQNIEIKFHLKSLEAMLINLKTEDLSLFSFLYSLSVNVDQ